MKRKKLENFNRNNNRNFKLWVYPMLNSFDEKNDIENQNKLTFKDYENLNIQYLLDLVHSMKDPNYLQMVTGLTIEYCTEIIEYCENFKKDYITNLWKDRT